MSKTIIARWRDQTGWGLEHLVLRIEDTRIVAEGVVLSGEDRTIAAIYRIHCNPRWRVRAASVSLIEPDRTLVLTSDGIGNWFDEAGAPLRQIQGAIDIDLSASPFTNTLPIRRCGLEIGQSVDIAAAYVSVPDLTLTLDPQRYTRIGEYAYRFDSLDSDFSAEIEVDEDGLVVDYEDLFRREPRYRI